ncbi:hypothetical protein B0F90DRAFT_1667717 [Multifurca ochricompacta]|uniref:Uncharacterized protein n=1 Tax=Multifurca ochricompacta TaxID=376703 RepID=A0AAD4M563_9AGAM|nr:hypothetical protein B0F90DRAFT_1667717 [Multifurca ochricompacta]
MASPSKPPMPCIANLKPTSASPIHFVYERRHFTVKTLPDSFPYEVIRDNGLQIHYFEFRGQGPPPSDLGYPGDVWLNVRPGELSLYARTLSEWVIWPGPRKAKKHMFEHPLITGRYLWCTRKHVLWYTCDGIRKSASLQTRGEEEDFGRTRYRTVGPMERGGARSASDNTPRFPLRTAEEAVAKILEVEDEERRHSRDAPEPKRRRVRESDTDTPHRAKSISEEPTPGSTSSGSRSTAAHGTPQAPAWNGDGRYQRQVSYNPGNMHFYPVSPSSSLSQALGPNAGPNPSPPSPPAVPPHESVSGPPISTFTTTPTTYATATLSPSSTSATSTLPPHPSPAAYPQHSNHPPRTPNFPVDAEISRVREEAIRLSAENARLCAENSRLLEENRSLRANAYCSPSLAEAVRDALGTTLGARVNELLRDAQEQRVARLEAERKLVEFQEQLKKMTQAFQIPTITPGNSGDAQLPSARSVSRLAASEA